MTTVSPQPRTNSVDPGISISTALLISMGVVMSYSATAALALDTKVPPLFFDHLIGLMIGLAAAAGAYSLPALALRRLAVARSIPARCTTTLESATSISARFCSTRDSKLLVSIRAMTWSLLTGELKSA